jgi:phosphoglycerate dehydrogenase-like enzyme
MSHHTGGARTFTVALTADFYNAAGEMPFKDMGLSVLDAAEQVEYFAIREDRPELGVDQIGEANAVVVLAPAVTRASLAKAGNLLAIGRFGVGYEKVDVQACTEADVLAMITAGAVDRSVAEATVGWMIALTHHMRIKDRLVRSGEWDVRTSYMGTELRDRTFGAVGMGGIARETIRLLSIFGMQPPLAYDPYLDVATAAHIGVKLVSLDELLANADFVSLHCPLTAETRGMIGARELSLMRRDAWLLNTARGGLVDGMRFILRWQTGRLPVRRLTPSWTSRYLHQVALLTWTMCCWLLMRLHGQMKYSVTLGARSVRIWWIWPTGNCRQKAFLTRKCCSVRALLKSGSDCGLTWRSTSPGKSLHSA